MKKCKAVVPSVLHACSQSEVVLCVMVVRPSGCCGSIALASRRLQLLALLTAAAGERAQKELKDYLIDSSYDPYTRPTEAVARASGAWAADLIAYGTFPPPECVRIQFQSESLAFVDAKKAQYGIDGYVEGKSVYDTYASYADLYGFTHVCERL